MGRSCHKLNGAVFIGDAFHNLVNKCIERASPFEAANLPADVARNKNTFMEEWENLQNEYDPLTFNDGGMHSFIRNIRIDIHW